jgi:GntR family transcriptional regulator
MPASLTDSYYPAGYGGRHRDRGAREDKGGVYALIEDPDGPIRRQVARSTDDVTGRMPTPDEARELVLPPGVPVFRVLRTVYDTEGRPLEVQDSVAAADRHQLRYEVEMR